MTRHRPRLCARQTSSCAATRCVVRRRCAGVWQLIASGGRILSLMLVSALRVNWRARRLRTTVQALTTSSARKNGAGHRPKRIRPAQFCAVYWQQQPAAMAVMQALMLSEPIEKYGPPSAELWSACLVRRTASSLAGFPVA